ncbi:MAG: hypothetical protein Q4C83_01525, partial [Candidatus Saccharibacteria bacterium]|nr:hypothetical protein [Candidatus Saccharibacteria bacterium]
MKEKPPISSGHDRQTQRSREAQRRSPDRETVKNMSREDLEDFAYDAMTAVVDIQKQMQLQEQRHNDQMSQLMQEISKLRSDLSLQSNGQAPVRQDVQPVTRQDVQPATQPTARQNTQPASRQDSELTGGHDNRSNTYTEAGVQARNMFDMAARRLTSEQLDRLRGISLRPEQRPVVQAESELVIPAESETATSTEPEPITLAESQPATSTEPESITPTEPELVVPAESEPVVQEEPQTHVETPADTWSRHRQESEDEEVDRIQREVQESLAAEARSIVEAKRRREQLVNESESDVYETVVQAVDLAAVQKKLEQNVTLDEDAPKKEESKAVAAAKKAAKKNEGKDSKRNLRNKFLKKSGIRGLLAGMAVLSAAGGIGLTRSQQTEAQTTVSSTETNDDTADDDIVIVYDDQGRVINDQEEKMTVATDPVELAKTMQAVQEKKNQQDNYEIAKDYTVSNLPANDYSMWGHKQADGSYDTSFKHSDSSFTGPIDMSSVETQRKHLMQGVETNAEQESIVASILVNPDNLAQLGFDGNINTFADQMIDNDQLRADVMNLVAKALFEGSYQTMNLAPGNYSNYGIRPDYANDSSKMILTHGSFTVSEGEQRQVLAVTYEGRRLFVDPTCNNVMEAVGDTETVPQTTPEQSGSPSTPTPDTPSTPETPSTPSTPETPDT